MVALIITLLDLRGADALPDLAVISVEPAVTNVVLFPYGPTPAKVAFTVTITNMGTRTSGDWHDTIFVSTNRSLTGVVASRDFWHFEWQGRVPAGASYQFSSTLDLPTRSGQYWLVAQANTDGSLQETTLTNNIGVSTKPVTLTYRIVPPDFAGLKFELATNTVVYRPAFPDSPTLRVSYTVTNLGPGDALFANSQSFGPWPDRIHISTNQDINGTILTTDLGLGWSRSSVLAGDSYSVSGDVELPRTNGTYWLFLEVNAGAVLYEENINNNLIMAPKPVTVSYEVVPPDLVAANIEPETNTLVFRPPSPQPPTITVVYTVTNAGFGLAGGSWADQLIVSTNHDPSGAVSSQYVWVDWLQVPVLTGGSYTMTNQVALPAQDGIYWFLLAVNPGMSLYEENPQNNMVVSKQALTVSYKVVPPDLVAGSIEAVSNNIVSHPPRPTDVPSVAFVFSIANGGLGDITHCWRERVYVSTNQTIEGSVLSQDFYTGCSDLPIVPGGVCVETNSIALPAHSGTYWLIQNVNPDGDFYEENLSNDIAVSSIPVVLDYQLVLPDLAALSVDAVSNHIAFHPSSPQVPAVEVVTKTRNQGAGEALGEWIQRIYVSTNGLMDGIISTAEWRFPWYSAVDPGAILGETNVVTLPGQSGAYWLIFEANTASLLYEQITNNNLVVSTMPITLDYEVVPPDLVPFGLNPLSNNVAFTPPAFVSTSISFVYSVTNQGAGDASSFWIDRVYVSTNRSVSGALLNLEVRRQDYFVPPVLAGDVYQVTNVVPLPTQSGVYWLLIEVNSGGLLYEGNYTNNIVVADHPVTLSYQVVPPDLEPSPVRPLTNRVVFHPPSPQSPTLGVVYSVTNAGLGSAEGNWMEALYIYPTNQSIQGPIASQSFYQPDGVAPLVPGGSYLVTNLLLMPAHSGAYWITVEANSTGWLFEENRENNVSVYSEPVVVDYRVAPADLSPVAVKAVPDPVVFRPARPLAPSVELTYAITNAGEGLASGYFVDTVYVGTNQSGSDAQVAKVIEPPLTELPAGAVYKITNSISLPQKSGDYWILVAANRSAFWDGGIYEENWGNNFIRTRVTVDYRVAPPDLAPASVALATNRVVYQTPDFWYPPAVDLICVVTNLGQGEAGGTWYDRVFISTNATTNGIISSQDFYRFYWEHPAVPTGGFYSQTNTVALPQQSGTYWIFFAANPAASTPEGLYEENTNNNRSAAIGPVIVDFNLTPPDLAPLSLVPQTNLIVLNDWDSQNLLIPVDWACTNLGPGEARGWFYDAIWISTNASLEGVIDTQVFTEGGLSPLAPGGVRSVSNDVRLPGVRGTYWLFLQLNWDGTLYERNTSNNFIACAEPIRVDNNPTPAALRPVSLEIQAVSGQLATVVWGITNEGASPTSLPWSYGFGFGSSSAESEANPFMVFQENRVLQPGACLKGTNSVPIPLGSEGPYFFSMVASLLAYPDLSRANAALTIPAPTGAIDLTVQPNAVASAMPRWSVDSGAWYTNSVLLTNLVIGSHRISFNPVDGWTQPPDISVMVAPVQVTPVAARYTPVSYVEFLDTNLEAAVRSGTMNPGEKLTSADLMRLEALNIASKGLRSLAGLEWAKNLQILDASGNQLTNVSPLAGLANLDFLDLSYNTLSNCSSFEQLTNLGTLRLRQCGITNIDGLAKLYRVGDLDLSGNQISDLSPLGGVTSLFQLDLSDNPLGDAPSLSQLGQLWGLFLDRCSLTNLSFLTSMKALNSLSLNQNPIGDRQALDIPPVNYLSMARTEITTLDFVTNFAMGQLYFNLYSIHASECRLTNISALDNGAVQQVEVFGNFLDTSETAAAGKTIKILRDRGTSVFADPQHERPLISAPARLYIPSSRLTSLTVGARGYLFDPNPKLVAFATTADASLLPAPALTPIPADAPWNQWRMQLAPSVDRAGSVWIQLTAVDPVGLTNSSVIDVIIERATNVVFADVNLEMSVRSALNLFDRLITTADLKNLEVLRAPKSQILSLAGLERASNLKTLDVSGNVLTNINVLAGLTTLSNLDLADNWLDISAGSAASNVVQILRDRNAMVGCQGQHSWIAATDVMNSNLEAPGLMWLTGGSVPWFTQSSEHHNGMGAAQSGVIGDGQDSWVMTAVAGPTRLSFWWKVSSEAGYDALNFSTNGVSTHAISGETGWQRVAMDLAAGNQVLVWRYSKDGLITGGRDAANLDKVTVAPVEPIFLADQISMSADLHCQFLIRNPHGDPYEVLSCTNLASGVWDSVGVITNQSERVLFTDPLPTSVTRFFRVRRTTE